MNNEDLRREIVSGIDRALELPWPASKLLNAEGRRLLRAQRRYWQEDGGAGLDRLSALLAQEPTRAEEDKGDA